MEYEKGGKNGKIHAHIAYMPPKMQTSTSNETKKFRACYEKHFLKKDYPKAIDHKTHDNWLMAIGYVIKDQGVDLGSKYKGKKHALTEQTLSDAKEKYKQNKKKPKRAMYTYSQFVEDYVEWKIATQLKEGKESRTNELLYRYMRISEVKGRLTFPIFTKLKFGRFNEYVDYKVDDIIVLSTDIACGDTYNNKVEGYL